ncbi:YMGG-like glycine zipper-containing protein [Mesorhizobium amorphae]|uniref:YMGG-like glycine zipper-containing protein n=1 Tax=Mesorhizobium amorphae TaxID=71433 RepID=UPI001783677A|nr:YMGG-like glycine zipper-containing protein [Mesorhizobium amorphae]
MRKVIIAMVAVVAISGCSTTEQDVGVGTLVGAGVGGLVGGGRGALIGAAVGAGSGLLVRNLRNGYCQYRDNRGRLYTARC